MPDTVEDLGFNVDEYGWKVSVQHENLLPFATLTRGISQAIISQRVPKLTSQAVPQLYNRLLSKPSLAHRSKVSKSLSYLASPPSETQPKTLDWMIHPGGSLIISKIENQLGLNCEDHTQASWNVYQNNGNTSSVSIGAVIERSREVQGREGCIAVAFGPGVTVEMCLLRRTGWRGSKLENANSDVKVNTSHGHTNANGVNGHHTNGNYKEGEATSSDPPETRAEKYADLGIHEETPATNKNGAEAEGTRLKRKPDSDLAEVMTGNKRLKTEGTLSSNGSPGNSV